MLGSFLLGKWRGSNKPMLSQRVGGVRGMAAFFQQGMGSWGPQPWPLRNFLALYWFRHHRRPCPWGGKGPKRAETTPKRELRQDRANR